MRSLFGRMFVWFWLAMVVVVALLIVSSPFFTRSRAGVERWQRDAEEHLAERAEEVVARLGRGEPWPPRPEGRRGHRSAPVFVLRADGAPDDDPGAPPEVVAFARRVAAAGEAVSERSGMFHMVGRPATAPDGTGFVVVVAARRPPRLVDLLDPGGLSWRLAVLTALVGVVCFWLARQLASPVARLQGAVRRIAAGDLAARVDARVEARRDEIGALARDFNAMAVRVDALVGAQRHLVRDVSHELRSPLARLRVALELARQGSGEKVSRALDRIEDEADRLNEMIEQLLTLSRLEAGARDAERFAFDLGALVSEVADDTSFEAGARSCSVKLEAAPRCEVVGSPVLLRSAVENVLRNAARYTAEGSEIEVTFALEGAQHDRRAVIGVRDHGPGVPEELLLQVFQPFFRVDDARERATGGTGLGLAIALRAVELHGGTIEARNAAGGGLLVTISLPAPDPGTTTA